MNYFDNDLNYEQLKLEAFSWIGTPYHHWRKEKGLGADCALFINEIFISLKIVDRVTYVYNDRFWFMFKSKELLLNEINSTFRNSLLNGFSLEEVLDFKRGDLLTFAISSSLTNHVALLLENNEILHSLQRYGVTIQSFTQEFRDCLTHHYRIIKV